MSIICPVCATPNPPAARECEVCRAALTSLDPAEAPGPGSGQGTTEARAALPPDEEPRPPEDPSAPPPDEERRPLEDPPAPTPDEEPPATSALPARVAGGHDAGELPVGAEPLGTAPLPNKPAAVPAGMTAASAPTEILPFDTGVLHPLPDGAVLADRYVVRTVVRQSPTLNLYRVVARNQQRCPTCGAMAALARPTCARCATPLTGQAPQPSYLAAEAIDRQILVRDPAVVERGLNHPNLMPLVDLFTDSPYGPPRYYTVTEARQGVPLNQLALPQPADQVLAWGTQLSDALRYLHEQGVLSPGATPANVLIKEDAAVLANLQEARPAPADPEERAAEFADDVAQLAGTLYEMLTGVYASAAGKGRLLPADLSDELEATFARALRPAPGSPPLTASAWHDMLLAARETLHTPLPSLRIRSGRISDVGRHRALNEDSLTVVECQVVQESHSASIGVYAIADGMGGHAGGEIASALAISTVTEQLLLHFVTPAFALEGGEPSNEQINTWLMEAVQDANARIHQERADRSTDMGTTLVAVVTSGQRAYIANVGDSRAYIWNPSEDNSPPLRQVTVDHSLVQRLVEMGQITAEEAKYHQYRNMIYKSLGERAQVEVDTFAERIAPGTRLLLCSDGLNGMVPDTQIAEILGTETDPQVACARLIAAANASGGLDNITAITIYVESG